MTITKELSVIVLLTSCALVTEIAMACNVFPEQFNNGHSVVMKNSCPFPVNVSFCYEYSSDGSSLHPHLSCQKGQWGGVMVRAYGTNLISNGMRPQVRWCKSPKWPSTSSNTCR